MTSDHAPCTPRAMGCALPLMTSDCLFWPLMTSNRLCSPLLASDSQSSPRRAGRTQETHRRVPRSPPRAHTLGHRRPAMLLVLAARRHDEGHRRGGRQVRERKRQELVRRGVLHVFAASWNSEPPVRYRWPYSNSCNFASCVVRPDSCSVRGSSDAVTLGTSEIGFLDSAPIRSTNARSIIRRFFDYLCARAARFPRPRGTRTIISAYHTYRYATASETKRTARARRTRVCECVTFLSRVTSHNAGRSRCTESSQNGDVIQPGSPPSQDR